MGSIESIKTSETIVWCDSYPFLLVRAFLDRRNPYIFLKIYINFVTMVKVSKQTANACIVWLGE